MPPSLSSRATVSSPCTIPGLTIRSYFTHQSKGRLCQQCSRSFALSTGNDSLKYHMHACHKAFAQEMRNDLPSFQRVKPSPSQSTLSPPTGASSAAPLHIPIDDDDDSPTDVNPLPLTFIPLHSLSSSASTLSSSSSASSVTSILPSTNKRVSAMPPPEPRPVKRAKSSQQSIKQWEVSDTERSAAARSAQVDFFLHEGLPFQLADSPALHLWLELHRRGDGAMLNRRQLAASLHDRVEGVMVQVIQRLAACGGVTVGIDGWTNVRHDKVINLCPLGRGVAYYWRSVVLQARADAQSQSGPISHHLLSLIDKGVRVVAIVTDNEAVNGAVYRRLRTDFPFLIHLPCAAHTIQLCVRKVMELPTVRTVVSALTALLAAFKASKELRVRLKAQQALLRRTGPLQLIATCDTRWNSTLTAAERVLELEHCIRPFIADIIAQGSADEGITYCDAQFWHPLAALVRFLQPYKVATDVVQSDSATLADVHEQFSALVVAADDIPSDHPLGIARLDVARCIVKEWHSHVHRSAVIMCALFSFSPAYGAFPAEHRTDADSWFEEWGTQFLLYYRLAESVDADTITCGLQNQLVAFNNREAPWGDVDHIRAMRAKVASADNKTDDVRVVWGLKRRAAPELAACVLALLELSASEAAVERSFSRQGLVHSKQRNRLSDDTVHLSMAFAFNRRALQHSTARSAQGWEELLDEQPTATDIVRGTSLLYTEDITAAAEESEDDGTGEFTPLNEATEASTVHAEAEADSEAEAEVLYRMEQEEKRPLETRAEEEQRTLAFMLQYIEENGISRSTRWSGPKESQLQSALITAQLKIQTTDMMRRIKDHLTRAQALSLTAEQ